MFSNLCNTSYTEFEQAFRCLDLMDIVDCWYELLILPNIQMELV